MPPSIPPIKSEGPKTPPEPPLEIVQLEARILSRARAKEGADCELAVESLLDDAKPIAQHSGVDKGHHPPPASPRSRRSSSGGNGRRSNRVRARRRVLT